MASQDQKDGYELQGSLTFICLDENMHNTENTKPFAELQSSILQCSSLITFDDTSECKRYLEDYNGGQNIALLASGRLGQAFIPDVHHLSIVSVIYIYCAEKEAYGSWTRQYEKVNYSSLLIDF